MTAGRICTRVIATASPNDTIEAAARRMANYGVGTLVVLEVNGSNRAAGILTDRDIVTRCIAKDRDPGATPVLDLMTIPVESVDESTPIERALALMAATAARRLVVTGHAQRVVGILSLDDTLRLLSQEVRAIGQVLEQQQPHIPL